MARRIKQLQNSFSSGELTRELEMRSDTQQYGDGARSLLNNRLLVGGGAVRRPGSALLIELPGDSIIRDFVVDENNKYIVAFSAGRFDAFFPDGAPAGGVAMAPWTASQFRFMDYAQSANTAFLTHQDLAPQVLTRFGLTSWGVAPLAFKFGPGARLNQPYFKLAPDFITLTPGAYTGTGITLSLSNAWWTDGFIGTRIRYMKRQIEITAVTSVTIATGTVAEELPATLILTVATASGFTVGQIVEGTTTGVKALVTGVPNTTTVRVVLQDTLAHLTTSDTLVSPTGRTAITNVAIASGPDPVNEWDEALFKAATGFPRAVEIHRNRLMLGGPKALPSALLGSRPDDLTDFDVGDGSDGDGFFELIGDAGAAQITQLHSTEQLLILTDRGPYYVPESAANPFRPSSIAFNHFGGLWPAANVRSGDFDGGVVMVSGSLVVKMRPTGDPAGRQFAADEVSLLSPHLFNKPVDAAFTTNFGGGPERYAVFVNTDGTIAVMQLVEEQKIRNFVPWKTKGLYRSVAALGGDIYAVVERFYQLKTRYVLEKFDQLLTLDAASTFNVLDELQTLYGYTPGQVNVITGRFHLGTWPVTLEEPPLGPYTVGFYYDRVIETLPPAIEDNSGTHSGEPMRITKALVRVNDSARFEANGHELTAYQVIEDPNLEPPLKNGAQRFTFLGWEREPTITIKQADPLPLNVLGINYEVAY